VLGVVVVLGDSDAFGGGLLRLGFAPLTSVGSRHLRRGSQRSCSSRCGLPPEAFSVVSVSSVVAWCS
jgi:hypothetical protein